MWRSACGRRIVTTSCSPRATADAGFSTFPIPRKDPNGTRVVKTCRINREVALYDFADADKPVLVKHWKVAGNPDIAQFHKGKVVIPCGHQGVLLQK